jgi:hypothetical protein
VGKILRRKLVAGEYEAAAPANEIQSEGQMQ